VGPRTSGFFVYRRLGGAAYDGPLVEEPLERRALSDTLVPRGTTACYVVRAVGSTQPLVESAPSNEACAEVRDIAPPAAPAGIALLPREGGLELLWSPSGDADLAGYRVYRAGPDGAMARIAEVGAGRAAWLDETVERGVTYRYTVTALDQAGNESERAEPVEASLP
jgi:fibronectin type 3 domain-containing protein